MSLLHMVVSAAGLIGVGWIFWLTLIDGPRRQAPVILLVVGTVDALCGLASFLLGGAHFVGVVGRALQGKGLHGAQAFTYASASTLSLCSAYCLLFRELYASGRRED